MSASPRTSYALATLTALVAVALSGQALAYESGSTGADGALNPTVDTQIQLPPDGVLNYTNVNIPSGVTVTFAKNTTNTPVVMLVGGDATIAGTIHVNGSSAAQTGAAGDGSIGDDGTPGAGGPGGYSGGQGGRSSTSSGERVSQPGSGPGAAGPSVIYSSDPCGGSGGGFGGSGGYAGNSTGWCNVNGSTTQGRPYGTTELLPLIGGSGGAGGAGGTILRGAGGGGGAGGLMIAVSGTLSVTGAVRANGGAGGVVAGAGVGGAGGGGSGGAIRLIATTITGNGSVTAQGGTAQRNNVASSIMYGGVGGNGRIRMEAESFTRTAASSPAHTFGQPAPAFVAGLPTLRISRVAGVDAPAAPTGNADIALPEETVNPVGVEVATSGVPLGNTVEITVTPAYGSPTTHISNALSGTEASATATASVTLPSGPSTLLATVTYSVPQAVAMQAPYIDLSGPDDLVERVALRTQPDGSVLRIATTYAGRELDLSAVAASGG